MNYIKVNDWQVLEDNIRYRKVMYYDFGGDECINFEFKVFIRPYFFNLIGRKKWKCIVTTERFNTGLDDCRRFLYT